MKMNGQLVYVPILFITGNDSNDAGDLQNR